MALKLDTILESINLVSELDDEILSSIGQDVIDGYDIDDESRKRWKEDTEKWIKLATQICEDKTFPWPNASNVKYPLITIAALQFAARAYPALISGSKSVKARVIGKPTLDKEAKAKRVATYMSYQVHEEMEEWEEDMDKLLISLPIVGTVFKKTYYDSNKGRNVSELVLAKDLCCNYHSKSLSNSSRITHILQFYPNELEERFRSGIYKRFDFVDSGSSYQDEATHGVSDEAHGLDEPQKDENSPRVMLEQHTWLDLDEDGYKEPYVITVDKASGKVTRIAANFGHDDIQINAKNEVVKITPTQYFTNFIFVPDPESGIYGFGFGKLLGPINETVNTTINQLLDAGTLSNLQSGFLGRGIRAKLGERSVRPGEWIQTNSTGDDLRKNIFPLPVKEPSGVLFSLLGMMAEAGQRVGSVSEMMMGENPGQNQPYSTTIRVMEEGLRVFSSIHTRIHRSLKKEYRLLFRLNSQFLDFEKYFTVLDEGTQEEAVVFQNDFDLGGVDVLPASDPNIVSESHKLARAEALMQLAMGGLVNPQEATKRLLEAQGQSGIEELMTLPKPQPNFETQLKMQIQEFEQQKFQMEFQRSMMELEVQMFKDKAATILSLAKAESLNDKTVLEQVRLQLEAMTQAEETVNKRLDIASNLSMVEMQTKQAAKSKAAELLQKDIDSERKSKESSPNA